mmetsp:Transcript_49350/g.154783  ORF Transcript_49350/g.154783 Transcript_49350/m.154783 type:complete len:571 (-) Transcript_49350:680-2392(-)
MRNLHKLLPLVIFLLPLCDLHATRWDLCKHPTSSLLVFERCWKSLPHIRGGKDKSANDECANCKKTRDMVETLLKCPWCRKFFYCGSECQKEHWPEHRNFCPPRSSTSSKGEKLELKAKPLEQKILETETEEQRRIRRRKELAENVDDDDLPEGWTMCSSCQNPVLIAWLECPSCFRPISEVEDDNPVSNIPPIQLAEMKKSGHYKLEDTEELMRAAEDNDIQSLENLIKKGIDVNFKSSELYGSSPLHYASIRGSVEAARLLLAAGAKVNIVNSQKESPLHWACEGGKKEMVELLVEQGGDCKLRSNFGETPLDFAISSCNLEVLDALKKAGVKVDDWMTEDKNKVWEEEEEDEDEEQGEKEDEDEDEDEEPFYLYENVTYNKTAEREYRRARLEEQDRKFNEEITSMKENITQGWNDKFGLQQNEMAQEQSEDFGTRDREEPPWAEQRRIIQEKMEKVRSDFEKKMEERDQFIAQGGDADDWPIYIPTDQPVMSVGQVVDCEEEPGQAKPGKEAAEMKGSWDTVEGEEAESLIQKMIRREMQEKGNLDQVPTLSSLLSRDMDETDMED